MISPRVAPYIIALLVSGGMSFMVSGLATMRAIGLISGFLGIWMTSWAYAWIVAFPALLVLRPLITRWVTRWIRDEP